MAFLLWNGREAEAADTSPDEVTAFVAAITGKRAPVSSESSADQAAEAELAAFVRDVTTPYEQWNLNRRRDTRGDRVPGRSAAADTCSDEVTSFVKALRGESTPVSTESFSSQPTKAQIQEFLRNISTCHEQYNPSQPRDAIGRWASTGAAGPSSYYLPSDTRGTWEGTPGNSKFQLEKPVFANGERVTHIEFKNGAPDLDRFALPGGTATIILTGDNGIDQINAKKAWQKLNPGKELPSNSVFHHDLLNTAEHVVTIDGKKAKVLVGKMPLLETGVHELFHQGSASVARGMYEGLKTDVAAVTKLATKEASLAGKEGSIVARAAGKIVSGTVPKSIRHLVGRSIARVIPIVSTGLAIIEFSDNVEAHGVAGAVARATPVLGDLISAHDLGSELAKQIRDDANAGLDAHLKALNAHANEAWDKASQQTIEAFHELAPTIQVTNPYSSEGRVDPHEVADALKTYRQAMEAANLLKAHNTKDFDFPAAAARAKQELKDSLTKACQRKAPPPTRPTL